MNERIRELAEQSGIEFDDDFPLEPETIYYLKLSDFEKFALLIVQEMIGLLEQYSQDSFPEDTIDDFDKGYLSGLYTARNAVKKYFGVEL